MSYKIKYDYSGSEEAVKKAFRCFKTYSVLEWVSLESNKKYNEFKAGEYVKPSYLYVYLKNSSVQQKIKVLITPWLLIYVAYYSIKYSNDYIGKEIEDENEFVMLCSIADDHYQKWEAQFVKKLDSDSLLEYLWGFGGEQFKFQRVHDVFDNSVRDLYILFEINDQKELNIEKIIKKVFGENISYKILLKLILYAGIYNLVKRESDYIISELSKVCGIDEEVVNKVLGYYSADYREVWQSPFNRQIFYVKPFVLTQKNKIIPISIFVIMFLYEHLIYWLIRNYYYHNHENGFLIYFGELFEKYFENVLRDCLEDSSFFRIEETDSKRADWKIIIDDYVFLVEQKSSLLQLGAKQQETDIEQIDNYLSERVGKALEQLKNTEKELCHEKCIKIILLYEDYLKPEILDIMTKENEYRSGQYWLVSIKEMEMFLWCYKTDKVIFNKILKEKIRREKEDSKEGKSIEQLLAENNIWINEYLQQEKFENYRKIDEE